MNAGRNGVIGDYWGCTTGEPVPSPFTGKALDDPMIIEAYYQYLYRSVPMINPNALIIGVEVDGHWKTGLSYWNSYVNLHISVYNRLKVDFPTLIIGVSIEHPYLYSPLIRPVFEAIFRYTDGIFLSSYPYGQAFELKQFQCVTGGNCQTGDFVTTSDGGSSMGATQDNFFKSDIFESVALYANSFGKLWGIHESGYSNNDINSTTLYYGYVSSNPTQQQRFMKYVLADLNEHNAIFTINWASINYEPLMDYFAQVCGNTSCSTFLTAMNWEYIGLLDGVPGATSLSQLPAFSADNVWYSYYTKAFESTQSSVGSKNSKSSKRETSSAAPLFTSFYMPLFTILIAIFKINV